MRNVHQRVISMWEFDAVSYARGLSFYELKEMEASVDRCHKLFGKRKTMNDLLYMLKIIDYGELQKSYKGI